MSAVKPVMLLVNDPIPAPSEVFESLVVGFVVVLQQTPLTVTGAPPSAVTFPPPEAVEIEIAVVVDVVTVAKTIVGGLFEVFAQAAFCELYRISPSLFFALA